MWRVVLDYAVLTSALLNPHCLPARLLDYALQGRLRLFATCGMLETQGRILRSHALTQRHGMTDRELSRFMADLPVLFCLIPLSDSAQAEADLDSELSCCAVRCHADYLVASRQLDATVAEQGGTQIVTADQLVKLVGRSV